MNNKPIHMLLICLLVFGGFRLLLESNYPTNREGLNSNTNNAKPKPTSNNKEVILPENRLSNGELIQRNDYYMDKVDGDHRITIDNTNGGSDAIVKFLMKNTNEVSFEVKVITMYIRQGYTSSVDSLPNGDYRLAFAYVDGYNYGTGRPLGLKGSQEVDEVYNMRTYSEGDYLVNRDLTITLYKVNNGNLQTNSISNDKFNEY